MELFSVASFVNAALSIRECGAGLLGHGGGSLPSLLQHASGSGHQPRTVQELHCN